MNGSHGNPEMAVWVVQGSLKTWILTPVPTCQRERGYCKSHRRHFSPPSGPAEFPGPDMQSTGCSHSNKGTLGVKVWQQIYSGPQVHILRVSPGQGTRTLSLWLCHVGMGRGQQAGTKVIWELESIESRVLILLPPLHFQCSDFMKFRCH